VKDHDGMDAYQRYQNDSPENEKKKFVEMGCPQDSLKNKGWFGK